MNTLRTVSEERKPIRNRTLLQGRARHGVSIQYARIDGVNIWGCAYNIIEATIESEAFGDFRDEKGFYWRGEFTDLGEAAHVAENVFNAIAFAAHAVNVYGSSEQRAVELSARKDRFIRAIPILALEAKDGAQ